MIKNFSKLESGKMCCMVKISDNAKGKTSLEFTFLQNTHLVLYQQVGGLSYGPFHKDFCKLDRFHQSFHPFPLPLSVKTQEFYHLENEGAMALFRKH